MSGIIMNQVVASSSLNGQASVPNPPQTPQTQHQQQPSIPAMQNINTHMQHDMQQSLGTPIEQAPNMNVEHQNHNFGQQYSNGIAYMNALSQGMNANNLVSRQGPSRTSSFAMGAPNPHTIRTVADFQALQRANSDISTMSSLGLDNGLGTEMDFMR